MKVKVLGSGCKKCKELEKRIHNVIDEYGIDASVEKVTDMVKIASYNVMNTPAVVIDEKVVSSGKLLKEKDILLLLQANK